MQEKQLQELLGSLSLTEKIGQLVQVPGEVLNAEDVYKRQVGEVGSDYPVEPAVFIGLVEGLKAIGEQSEGTADENTLCIHFLQLSGGIQHAFSGGNHIVNNDNVLSVNAVSQEFMGDDGVLAVYNGGIIAALVEHAGIDAEYISEIYGAVKGAFIGADNDSMILIDDQIILRIKQRPHELIRRRKIVKTVERGCVLYPWVCLLYTSLPELTVIQPFNRIIAIKPILSPGSRLNIPDNQIHPQSLSHRLRQHRLPCPRFPLNQ